MSLISSIAIYFVIWWVTLFVVLPFGVRSQIEAGNVIPGTEGGAPAHPRMLRNVVWTTIVATVFFALFYANYVGGYLTLENIPLLPRPPAA
jgi:predicted secreted protein